MIKQGFLARDGYNLVAMDQNQMELRLLAWFANDPIMKKVYASGGDVHQTTADSLQVDRKRTAKAINFGITYGMGPWTLLDNLTDVGVETDIGSCRRYIINIKKTYPCIGPWFNGTIDCAKKKGYVRSPFGRYHRMVYYCPPIVEWKHGKKRVKYDNSYSMPNRIIQGTGADIMKIAIAELYSFLKGKKSHILLQIHDELLFEIHEEESNFIPTIKGIMENFPMIEPHLKVGVKTGKRWSELQEVNVGK